MRGSSRKFGVHSAHFTIISCVISMRSCCVFDSPRLLHFPLLAVYLLSCRPVFPPGHQLLLPRCGQIPCALPPMRTLAPLPSTTLSQVMSPTTSTSRRLLNLESTGEHGSLNSHDLAPSAWRSLHHCSPRSEKMQRGGRRAYHSHDEGLSSSQDAHSR